MAGFTLYADIYPSGHKKLVQELKAKVDKGMPKLTGIISQHDASNGYWSNIQACAENVLVEPPLTKSFYRKDVDDQGRLIVKRLIEPKHMPHTDLWGEIVSDSIADALRKPTKGEAIISPVLDTYKDTTGIPLNELQANVYSIKEKGHDHGYELFNKYITDYVIEIVNKKKNDGRPIYAGIFLDSEEIKDPEFIKIVKSYSKEVKGYFLVMQDINYQSRPEKLLALKDFISMLLEENPEGKIVLYRTGMLGALYSALFPKASIGSTYGLPYRDTYNIRNINPIKESRPLKNSKLVYSPILLSTVKIPDALKTWEKMGIEISPTEAHENLSFMLNMAEKTQQFAHKINECTDKIAFLKEHLSNGIKFMEDNKVLIASSYGEHLKSWLNLL